MSFREFFILWGGELLRVLLYHLRMFYGFIIFCSLRIHKHFLKNLWRKHGNTFEIVWYVSKDFSLIPPSHYTKHIRKNHIGMTESFTWGLWNIWRWMMKPNTVTNIISINQISWFIFPRRKCYWHQLLSFENEW